VSYVAVGCRDGKVYLHCLDNAEVVGVLHYEAGCVDSLAVSEASSSRGLPDGTCRVDTTWLLVGEKVGVVRIWEVETKICFARLHALIDGHEVPRVLHAIEIARDRGRVVAWEWSKRLLHVWDISSEGKQLKYARVHGSAGKRFGPVEFAFAAACRLADSRPRLKDCSNQVACFGPRNEDMGSGVDEISVSVETDLVFEGVKDVKHAIVRCCDSRTLVATVSRGPEAITILDAVTGKMLGIESPPRLTRGEEGAVLCAVAASQVDGFTLVATGHADGMTRVRKAESGAQIAEWQAPSRVLEVLMEAVARRVMALCEDGALRIWSFAGDDGPDDDSGASAAHRGGRLQRPATTQGKSAWGWIIPRWADGRLL
jgi:WD40 repeat protein